MPVTYTKADEDVLVVVSRMLEKYDPDLAKADAEIDVMMAQAEVNEAGERTGHAVTCHRMPAYAKVRTIGLKDRTAGRGDWARSLRDQCQAAGVPFFFKQWGEFGATCVDMLTGLSVFRRFKDKLQWIHKARTWVNGGVCVDRAGKVLLHGGDFDRAEYPVAIMHRIGKKAAGRLLDGREWNEFPEMERASCSRE